MHVRARASTRVRFCLRLPYAPRRSRVPIALCVCRAWDRHCLLLLVLLSPGHGRRADAWPIEIARHRAAATLLRLPDRARARAARGKSRPIEHRFETRPPL